MAQNIVVWSRLYDQLYISFFFRAIDRLGFDADGDRLSLNFRLINVIDLLTGLLV